MFEDLSDIVEDLRDVLTEFTELDESDRVDWKSNDMKMILSFVSQLYGILRSHQDEISEGNDKPHDLDQDDEDQLNLFNPIVYHMTIPWKGYHPMNEEYPQIKISKALSVVRLNHRDFGEDDPESHCLVKFVPNDKITFDTMNDLIMNNIWTKFMLCIWTGIAEYNKSNALVEMHVSPDGNGYIALVTVENRKVEYLDAWYHAPNIGIECPLDTKIDIQKKNPYGIPYKLSGNHVYTSSGYMLRTTCVFEVLDGKDKAFDMGFHEQVFDDYLMRALENTIVANQFVGESHDPHEGIDEKLSLKDRCDVETALKVALSTIIWDATIEFKFSARAVYYYFTAYPSEMLNHKVLHLSPDQVTLCDNMIDPTIDEGRPEWQNFVGPKWINTIGKALTQLYSNRELIYVPTDMSITPGYYHDMVTATFHIEYELLSPIPHPTYPEWIDPKDIIYVGKDVKMLDCDEQAFFVPYKHREPIQSKVYISSIGFLAILLENEEPFKNIQIRLEEAMKEIQNHTHKTLSARFNHCEASIYWFSIIEGKRKKHWWES